MTERFRIGISADFKTEAPGKIEPILAEIIEPLAQVDYDYFAATGDDSVVVPQDIADFDAVLSLAVRYTADTFTGNDRVTAIARWGVGYDMVDVSACTANDVLLAITIDAVRRPVAEAILTLICALGKRLFDKDRVVRTGRWDQRAAAPAIGFRGKTLGSIGLGNIGNELFRLVEPLGFARKLAADPYADPARAAEIGVELVDLETLFRECDFVTVNCFLNEETHHLVNAEKLALMKPSSYLINTARGPIVNLDDLVTALDAGQLAGAGLDVLDPEPFPADHPLVQMENVILSPHTLAWTDELYYLNGTGACDNILNVFQGQAPNYTVNRDVVARLGFQAKLQALGSRWQVLNE